MYDLRKDYSDETLQRKKSLKKLHHFGSFSPSRHSRCNTKINASHVNECQRTASCTKIFLAQHFCYPHFSISFFLWIIFSELNAQPQQKKKHFRIVYHELSNLTTIQFKNVELFLILNVMFYSEGVSRWWHALVNSSEA